jgi:hypothetical protein
MLPSDHAKIQHIQWSSIAGGTRRTPASVGSLHKIYQATSWSPERGGRGILDKCGTK